MEPRVLEPSWADTDDPRRVRIGHGVLAHLSEGLVDAFAEKAICMEICLSANKRIGLPHMTKDLKLGAEVTSASDHLTFTLDRSLSSYFRDLSAHPLALFVERGVPVCLGSDNPVLMNTNISKEMTLASQIAGVNEGNLLDFTRVAIRYANIDQKTRSQLLDKVNCFKDHALIVV